VQIARWSVIGCALLGTLIGLIVLLLSLQHSPVFALSLTDMAQTGRHYNFSSLPLALKGIVVAGVGTLILSLLTILSMPAPWRDMLGLRRNYALQVGHMLAVLTLIGCMIVPLIGMTQGDQVRRRSEGYVLMRRFEVVREITPDEARQRQEEERQTMGENMVRGLAGYIIFSCLSIALYGFWFQRNQPSSQPAFSR
jgi:hypothetical protein